jgi:hypothetical protein
MHISIYFLCQTWHTVNKDIRRLFNNLFIFKTSKMNLKQYFMNLIQASKTKQMKYIYFHLINHIIIYL